MSYGEKLVNIFPFGLSVSKLQARVFSDALLSEGYDGSSFAISIDENNIDKRDLWLSYISLMYLVREFDLDVDMSGSSPFKIVHGIVVDQGSDLRK